MSGIAGILNAEADPVSVRLLRSMADAMSFRGPDDNNTWVAGHIGFAHTLLRTSFESIHEKQPLSFDNKVCITADARIDGREELLQKLKAAYRSVDASAPDVDLILHAYHVWGTDCVHHLIGDFAFAIWDGEHKRLFCARDHFGIKPFFYAHARGKLVFGNTLEVIRIHPEVSDDLDDSAIADFLLFSHPLDPDATSYSAIRRLPAAHTLVSEKGRLEVSKYWIPPVEAPIRYKNPETYLQHFNELLDTAVRERLRTDRAAIMLSGGLDSTAIARSAAHLRDRAEHPLTLSAVTVVYEHLIPDDEKGYVELVSKSLGIPVSYLKADNYRLFERWGAVGIPGAEPADAPLLAQHIDTMRMCSEGGRVVLSGSGGDEVLRREFLIEMLLLTRSPRPLMDALYGWLVHGQRPAIGLKSLFRGGFPYGKPETDPLPEWLQPDLVERLDLAKRWADFSQRANNFPRHPWRNQGYRSFFSYPWSHFFEGYDPGLTSVPVEVRWPFLDIRLVQTLLRFPAFPWSVSKYLLRQASRGTLPKAVLDRTKTPVSCDFIQARLDRPESAWLKDISLTGEVAEYMRPEKIRYIKEPQPGEGAITTTTTPLALNFWLNFRRSTKQANTHET